MSNFTLLDEIEEDLLLGTSGEIDIDSEDFYSNLGRERLLENDEITVQEDWFMKGWERGA